jgi:lipopolysaccharide assembly protein A
MLMLILFLVVGSALAYVSQYNFEPTTVNLGFYVFSEMPLFYVMIGSFVAGLILAYLIHLIHAISASLALRGKEKEIKKNKDEVLELTKRVHQLEIENEKLKHESADIEPVDRLAL